MAALEDAKIEVVSSDSGTVKDSSKVQTYHNHPYSSIQEQGDQGENSEIIDYYDIMIVGITGQGKSTTADKMVLASNPDKVIDIDSETKGKQFYVWLVGASPDLMKEYLERLARSIHSENPHLHVNAYYEELVEDGTKPPNTFSCQLISNEANGIRVLDVPGFFGDTTSTPSPCNDARINLCTQEHIAAMRSILRIQSTMRMRFRRILYFLPVRGPLTNRSGILMHDLHLLNQFFGKCVFECMILVATLPTYQKDSILPEDLLKKTQFQFRKALMEVLRPFTSENAIPSPPAIFISMSDDCEKIVEKVKSAEVARDSLEISIHQGICIKCSSLINWIDEERVECIPVGMMEDSAVPIEESFCHPIFLPKGCTLETIEFNNDGVPYVVFSGKNLNESMEICLNCGEAPGTKGCMKIGNKFTVNVKAGKSEDLILDHTNKIEHHRILDQREEQNIEKSLDRSIRHGGGRSQSNDPQHPQHRIIETTGACQNGAPSGSVLSPRSSAVKVPESQGQNNPHTSDIPSEEETFEQHRSIRKHGHDSPFVAEASEHDPSVKIVHGTHLSDEVEGGVWDGVRKRKEVENSSLDDPELDEVKG